MSWYPKECTKKPYHLYRQSIKIDLSPTESQANSSMRTVILSMASADSMGFKLACNVHVWAYFEKIPVSGKNLFFTKMAYGLGQDIACIKILVVSDLETLFK